MQLSKRFTKTYAIRVVLLLLLLLFSCASTSCLSEQKKVKPTGTQKTLDSLAMNRNEVNTPDTLLVEESGVYYGFNDSGYYVLINLFFRDSLYFGTASLNGESLVPFNIEQSQLFKSNGVVNLNAKTRFVISDNRDSIIFSSVKHKKLNQIPLIRKFVFGSYHYKDSIISATGFYPQYLIKKYGVVSLNNSLRENTLSTLTNNITDQLSLLQDSATAVASYNIAIVPEITFYSPILFSYSVHYHEVLNNNNSINWYETDNYEITKDSIRVMSIEGFIGEDSSSRGALLSELNKKLNKKRGDFNRKTDNPSNFEDLLNYTFDDKKTTFIYPSRKSYGKENTPFFITVPHTIFEKEDSISGFVRFFIPPLKK